MGEPSRARTGVSALGRLLLGHLAAFRDPRLQDVATAALRQGDRQAWVVSVLNASLRVRRWLTELVYLRPRAVMSRLAFRLRSRNGGVPAPPQRRLSLLCPTRGRVPGVATFLRSLERSAVAPGRVEALFYVDADDPDLPAYRSFFADTARRYRRLAGCVLHVGEAVGVPAAWNTLAAAAGGDLLMMANDDQLYVDYGWDVRLEGRVDELAEQHPDEVLCLYFEAGQYPDGGCDFPIVSRGWYEALGYFTPTIFQQWEVEVWIFDLARRIGRLYAVPGVLVEHRHYQTYKAPFDATYQRHRLTREKSFADHALFLQTQRWRERDAELLREAIRGVPHRFPDAADFWFTAYLEEHAEKVRAEVDATGAAPDVPLHLLRDGQWQHEACARLPVTAAVVAAIPEATSFGPGEVSLRRVGGRTSPPRRAGAAGALRVYLGLHVPAGTMLRAGATVTWPPGTCVVVDDTVQYDIQQADGEDPLALVLDVRQA
jgi:Aspartyl/Asparaginyl beta-hydroxylase